MESKESSRAFEVKFMGRGRGKHGSSCSIKEFLVLLTMENSLGMIYKVIEQEGLSIIVDQAEFIYMVLG